jgi:FkbM family methyltransferase
MKNLVTVKDNNWIWPAADVNGWTGQNDFLDLREQIKPYLKGENVMIQAGGNCGLVVSTFVDLFNTIYTFEPEPLNFYCLTNNVSSTNVVKIQACLGETTRLVEMQPLQAHVVDVGGFHVDTKTGAIPMFTIDSLNVSKCDLIQLDIEGYEYNALMGGLSTIKKYKPVICVEVAEEYLNRYGNTSAQVEELLTEIGYEFKAAYGSDRIYAPVN